MAWEDIWHVTYLLRGALVGKSNERRVLERPRRIWENNIKVDLREVEWEGGSIDWIDLAQNRDRLWFPLKAVINLRVLQNARTFMSS
jgi:hypothetical protein